MHQELNNQYLLSSLEKTRQRLLDQTRRNRILNYKETGRDIAIIDEVADLVFEDLVFKEKSFYFEYLPDNDSLQLSSDSTQNETELDRTLPTRQAVGNQLSGQYTDNKLQTPFTKKELERRLRKLYQESRSLIEETGANSLFVAMGFLEWSDSEDESRPARAPLMLVPVQLEREGSAGQAQYKLNFDDAALDSNYSLIEKLRSSFDLNFPTLEEEETPEKYWERAKNAIQTKSHQWRVVHEMALGLFRFSKQVMWHDLNPERWPSHAPLVDKAVLKRILVGVEEGQEPPGQLTDDYQQDGDSADHRVDDIKLIRDADSSQYSALIDSLHSESGLVIEGPPGTGKSQTITNLIAAAMDKGLSVLFVAEKMAALEVVYRRLEDTGLDPFCLQLHGLKTSKKELLSAIQQRLDHRASSITGLDQSERQLKQAKKELTEFSKILSEKVGPQELPLYNIVWRIERLQQQLPSDIDSIELSTDESISFEAFTVTKNSLDDLGSEWGAIPESTREAWIGFLPRKYNADKKALLIDSNNLTIESLRTIEEYLNETGAKSATDALYQPRRLLSLAQTPANQTVETVELGLDTLTLHRILQHDALDDYRTLLEKISDYLSIVESINHVFDYSDSRADEYANQLSVHCDRLANVAINDSVTIGELKDSSNRFAEAIEALESLPNDARYVLQLTNTVARTVDDYQSTATDAKELVQGPVELSMHASTNHLRSSIKNYQKKSRQEFDALVGRAEKLRLFSVDRVKSASEVEELVTVLAPRVTNVFAFFSADYRRAKKRVKQLLMDPNSYQRDQPFIDNLEQLQRLCQDREEFDQHADYASVLGSLYRGVKTDWQALDQVIEFSQKLKEKVGSEYAGSVLADWDTHVDKVGELHDRIVRSLQTATQFKADFPFPKRLWQRPVTEIASTLKPWAEKVDDAHLVLGDSWCRGSTTLVEGVQTSEQYRKARSTEAQIEAMPGFRQLLGGQWERGNTDLAKLTALHDWIVESLSCEGMTVDILFWLFTAEGVCDVERYYTLHAKICAFTRAWEDSLRTLAKLGEVNAEIWLGGKDQDIVGLIDKLNDSNATIDSLPILNRWVLASESVRKEGLGVIADNLASGYLTPDQCGKAYEYNFYHNIFTQKAGQYSALGDFSDTRYQNLRERFSELDRSILEVNAKQIAARLNSASVTEGVSNGPVRNYTEKHLLRHEANKKTRHIPIRQLTSRASSALKALNPCFLMSPLSVAQYLEPGKIHFDLVVMDEASQLRPEDALGAIARADKAIIVGDPKQLPPTNFFEGAAAVDEEEEVTAIDDTESILDVCLKQFPYRRLRWHYRSEHESLIQFSNDQFYDGDLIVFPSPKPDSRDFGVHYNYVTNPSYKKGKNRHEAELIVENIVHHYHRHAHKSLGVAAFNKSQAEEISLLLDKERMSDPALDAMIRDQNEEEPLFIKNLENVQGDERDVIFISTTYGPDTAGGPVAQRFGPINSDLGWRRLNVIATRAKQRVEIFSSMRPTDIRIGEGARKGVRALRDYLDYACTGSVPDRGISTGKGADSEFEVAVMHLIDSLGYECEPQVGVAGFYIDIGVINPDRPGEYLLGIECDGATYHSAISVRDRDRLRQEILESKGWYIHRIWSTNWFHSRAAEIDRLKQIIEERLAHERSIQAAIADFEDVVEVVTEATYASEDEIEKEQIEEAPLLEEALERFWHHNIGPRYADRERSILSERMIQVLVNQRPTTREEWFNSVPEQIRAVVNPDEGEFRQDIFDIIAEYD